MSKEKTVSDKKGAAFRLGVNTFLILMVLTLVEYWVGVQMNSAVFLFILALVKAALIVNNFMHATRLWREESH